MGIQFNLSKFTDLTPPSRTKSPFSARSTKPAGNYCISSQDGFFSEVDFAFAQRYNHRCGFSLLGTQQ